MVTHICCLTFKCVPSLLCEVEGPNDWAMTTIEAKACEKARASIKRVGNAPLVDFRYLGTSSSVIHC